MTDDQINAAIAEVCGWKKPSRKTVLNEKGFFVTQHAQSAPNYCTDLNAMHEAEKKLVGGISAEYAEHLLEVTGRNWSDDIQFFCATARQRAEAFLRTLGKWEEDK